MVFCICLDILVTKMLSLFDRGGITLLWRHNDVHWTCYWNLLLFHHRTSRFRRKKQFFSLWWGSFLSMIWNLYIAKKRLELNFWIYFVRLYNFIFISEKNIKNIIQYRQDLKENLRDLNWILGFILFDYIILFSFLKKI